MRHLLALSTTGAPPPPPATAILPDPVSLHRDPRGWVAFSAVEPGDEVPEPDVTGDGPGRFTVRLTRAARTRCADLSTARLADLLGEGAGLDGATLAGVLPPFAAAHRRGRGAPVVLVGDWLGLRHLYWWQGPGVAAVSTSARALAAVAGAGFDFDALGVQSLLGWQVGHATAYAGITKLAPGCAAVLHQGRVEIRRYAEPALPVDPSPPPPTTVVDEMAGILRELHESYLADHPDTVLQLSGGQDSRLQLAAVPPPLRRGMRAFTLDVHGGAESRVAGLLARLSRLDHQVIWLDERPATDPATAHRAALAAAADLDGMASPLAQAPLDLVEADLVQGHRLSGTGGETARGFYYPGQPRRADRSSRLVARLAKWRLYPNEAVAGEALAPAFVEAAHAAAQTAIGTCFEGYHRDWLRATDEFYLWQRVQRWAGAHDTPAATTRHLVNSLLDRRFLQLALQPAPDHKRGSRLTGALARRLDAPLAAVPLDSGLVPARLAAPGAAAALASARVGAGKTARKVWQRVRGGRRAQLGAAELGGLALTHWRTHPELLDPVRGTGIIRSDWLDELLDARRDAAPTTLAFLTNLLALTQATECRLSDSPDRSGPVPVV